MSFAAPFRAIDANTRNELSCFVFVCFGILEQIQ